jgi:hypothetical protein
MSLDRTAIAEKLTRKATRRATREAKAAAETKRLSQDPAVAALMLRPRPLVDPDRKLVVVFSPKSACTSVAIWFFNLIGHLKAARDYHEWPHQYRTIHYQSALYNRALRGGIDDYTVVRVVRDPYDRVTSSFRHAVSTGYADDELSAAIPEYDREDRRISFSRFLDFLQTEDLSTCNPHHGLQYHPIEDLLKPGHAINISRQDLFTRLNEVEVALGLPHTDFPSIAWIHDLSQKRHVAKVAFEGDAVNSSLDRERAAHGPWPAASALLTPDVRQRIAKLYGPDVSRYGLPTES